MKESEARGLSNKSSRAGECDSQIPNEIKRRARRTRELTLHRKHSGVFFLRACRKELEKKSNHVNTDGTAAWKNQTGTRAKSGCKKSITYYLPSGTSLDLPRRGSALPRNESLPETPRGPQACCWAISCPRATVTPEPQPSSHDQTHTKKRNLDSFFSLGYIRIAFSQQKCWPAIEEKRNMVQNCKKEAQGRR